MTAHRTEETASAFFRHYGKILLECVKDGENKQYSLSFEGDVVPFQFIQRGDFEFGVTDRPRIVVLADFPSENVKNGIVEFNYVRNARLI